MIQFRTDGTTGFFTALIIVVRPWRNWEGVIGKQFFPKLVDFLLESQAPDGSWPEEPYGGDGIFGNEYTTALAVLSLTPPYQLLPVYQR